jgi:hypothetical protein
VGLHFPARYDGERGERVWLGARLVRVARHRGAAVRRGRHLVGIRCHADGGRGRARHSVVSVVVW